MNHYILKNFVLCVTTTVLAAMLTSCKKKEVMSDSITASSTAPSLTDTEQPNFEDTIEDCLGIQFPLENDKFFDRDHDCIPDHMEEYGFHVTDMGITGTERKISKEKWEAFKSLRIDRDVKMRDSAATALDPHDLAAKVIETNFMEPIDDKNLAVNFLNSFGQLVIAFDLNYADSERNQLTLGDEKVPGSIRNLIKYLGDQNYEMIPTANSQVYQTDPSVRSSLPQSNDGQPDSNLSLAESSKKKCGPLSGWDKKKKRCVRCGINSTKNANNICVCNSHSQSPRHNGRNCTICDENFVEPSCTTCADTFELPTVDAPACVKIECGVNSSLQKPDPLQPSICKCDPHALSANIPANGRNCSICENGFNGNASCTACQAGFEGYPNCVPINCGPYSTLTGDTCQCDANHVSTDGTGRDCANKCANSLFAAPQCDTCIPSQATVNNGCSTCALGFQGTAPCTPYTCSTGTFRDDAINRCRCSRWFSNPTRNGSTYTCPTGGPVRTHGVDCHDARDGTCTDLFGTDCCGGSHATTVFTCVSSSQCNTWDDPTPNGF